MSLPSIVIGEYYFAESFLMPRPLVFLSSYCTIGRKRALPYPQIMPLNYTSSLENVTIYPNGHRVDIYETSDYPKQSFGAISSVEVSHKFKPLFMSR